VAVTPIYTSPTTYFTRSYLNGFVGCVGCSNMRWSGLSTLVVDFVGGFRFDLVVKFNVYSPNSNTYTLDYVFDNPASQVYLGGVPVASAMWYGFHYMTTRPGTRIHILSSLPVDETQTLDLPPMPSTYWRPQP
jgi:hypothetical protein